MLYHHIHRRTGRGGGQGAVAPQFGQFVDINSGRESRLFGQNTIHVWLTRIQGLLLQLTEKNSATFSPTITMHYIGGWGKTVRDRLAPILGCRLTPHAAKWGFRGEACFRVRQAFYCWLCYLSWTQIRRVPPWHSWGLFFTAKTKWPPLEINLLLKTPPWFWLWGVIWVKLLPYVLNNINSI